jgi:L-malate glycosyltransferase
MRIAIISTMEGSPWGGSEELWAAMAMQALKKGHEVLISVCDWPQTPPALALLQRNGARISKRPPAALRGVRRYLGPFRHGSWKALSSKADVICVSQGSTFDACMPAHRRLFDECVATPIPFALICQFNSEHICPSTDTCRRAVELFSKAVWVGMVSERQIPLTERQLAHRLSNALVLRNPVNLEEPGVLAPWPSSQATKMAVVARLDITYKGQDVLLETLGHPPWPDRNWELSFFGDGPHLTYLKKLADFFRVATKVRFCGHVGNIRGIWREHHILALPSRAEGTPLAMVEAMLCGRPAVVTDVIGNSEWIEEGLTGFLAEAPTVRSISRALERAWQARASWEQMGFQAHRKALEQYDPLPGRTLLELLEAAATKDLGETLRSYHRAERHPGGAGSGTTLAGTGHPASRPFAIN